MVSRGSYLLRPAERRAEDAPTKPGFWACSPRQIGLTWETQGTETPGLRP